MNVHCQGSTFNLKKCEVDLASGHGATRVLCTAFGPLVFGPLVFGLWHLDSSLSAPRFQACSREPLDNDFEAHGIEDVRAFLHRHELNQRFDVHSVLLQSRTRLRNNDSVRGRQVCTVTNKITCPWCRDNVIMMRRPLALSQTSTGP